MSFMMGHRGNREVVVVLVVVVVVMMFKKYHVALNIIFR